MQLNITKHIDSIGFYHCSGEGIPSLTQLKKMISECAYYKWLKAGKPKGRDWEFWLTAEQELFGNVEDGYNIKVCDLDLPENKGFREFWDITHVPELNSWWYRVS
jgi:hypothetical protein